MRKLRDSCEAMTRGFKDIREAKDDPDRLVEILDDLRSSNAPVDVRLAAVKAMDRHGASSRVMRSLTETIHDGEHWRERSIATVALHRIGTPEARALLLVAREDPDKRVRANAEISIKQIERRPRVRDARA
jgi:HEAT repeat protein